MIYTKEELESKDSLVGVSYCVNRYGMTRTSRNALITNHYEVVQKLSESNYKIMNKETKTFSFSTKEKIIENYLKIPVHYDK